MTFDGFMRTDYKEYSPTGLSIYEYFEKQAKICGSKTAISFYGIKTTYDGLLDKINEAERALRARGIKKGDIIAVSLPGIPEAVHLIYAINKIGAIYCAFDCRSKENEIIETLIKFKPKLCIIPSFQLKAFKNIYDQKVVVVEPTHSIGGITNISMFTANVFTGRIFIWDKHDNFIKYNDFLKKEKLGENLQPEKNDDNIFGYFYTSGTTYGRKSIILTNENVNAAAYQNSMTENWSEIGNSMLDIMPMFTCYGVTIGMHLPLSIGIEVKLIPLIDTKKMKKILLREKPSYLISVPAHWEYFVKEKFDGCDLSFLKTVIVGGDKISDEYYDKINDIFSKCGSSAWLRCGYGLSESTSVGTTPFRDTPKGSVGRPGTYTLIGVFDKDTCESVLTGEKGEICIYGPTVCKGYYEDEKMTNMLLKMHKDGTVWLHSGDVGYLDENGNLFFCERLKRMYVRYDGTKISPYSIEEVIQKCPHVSRCMIVAVRDEEHTCGMCARALIVLRKNKDRRKVQKEVEKYIRENLGMHMIPKEILYVEELPYTKNGKLDYFSVQQTK